MGMPDRFINDLVKSLHNALPGKPGSGSALLELLLQKKKKVHPAFRANSDPLVKWAMTAYANDQPHDLFDAWRSEITTVGLAKNPWQTISGPAGGTIATPPEDWVGSSRPNTLGHRIRRNH